MKDTYLSTKRDGSMNEKENIIRYLKNNNIDPEKFVRGGLVHGKEVEIVDNDDAGKVIKGVDGLITTKKLSLGVTVADCLPVYIRSSQITGILHCGWKSLYKGIIKEAIQKIEKIGEDSENLSVYVGPSIKVCHFEVKKDLMEKFSKYQNCFEIRDGKTFLSLQKVLKQKFNKHGVRGVNLSDKCTYCNKELFSYRRDNKLNNMLAVIKPTK